MATSESFSVGWICTKVETFATARALLDNEYDSPPREPHDNNSYFLGRMGDSNVVLACLPAGLTGPAAADAVAVAMYRTFPQLEICLVVGVGSGFPRQKKDIRLGDVVVSAPTANALGIVKYKFNGPNWSPPTSKLLLSAVNGLRRRYQQSGHDLAKYLAEIMRKYPKMREGYSYPGADIGSVPGGTSMRTTQDPVIHYGLIGSGDQLVRDKATRDRLIEEVPGVIGLEREGAGRRAAFQDSVHVVQGVCDYGDSQETTRWTKYAAATAAAYAKELTISLSNTTGSAREEDCGGIYEAFQPATVMRLQGQPEPKQEASLAMKEARIDKEDSEWNII